MQKEITFDSFIRGILTCLIICGILYLINRLSSVLLPFFIAWLIAYMIYPLVTFYQEKLRLKNRVLAIITVILTIALIFTGIFYIIIPPIIEEFARLKDLFSDYFISGSKQAAIPGTIQAFIQEHINMNGIVEVLDKDNFTSTIQQLWPKLWYVINQSFNAIEGLINVVLIMIYVFFILLDYETISQGWIKFVPIKYRHITYHIVNDAKDGMNKYFRGQALVAFLVGILFCIGFLIIDFPLAIGLGLLIGLLNMVPYLQLIGFIPVIILALLKAADTGENFWLIMLGAFFVFCVVQLIQDMLIVPKIMGKITGLNPAIILLSLSIWGSLMGILGMIIALPLTSLLLSYYNRYIKIKEFEFKSNCEQSVNKEDI